MTYKFRKILITGGSGTIGIPTANELISNLNDLELKIKKNGTLSLILMKNFIDLTFGK